ncbi:hypothetical protein [Candidatus Neptunichlamydia sp. REUL1]|uniref:hypothetical protein n=1 Tax=Candidatus Neptunichlamydia sp. REUL1 TaxID=3064277 RepID=UPI002931AC25|nr:hypothetical protein [Candidatus Neptunochlamydia sp. REUL1]
MRLGKLLFFFCLPALIWNAPLISSAPSQKRPTFCPWDLLKFQNLSYDNITSFIETVEYGDPSQFFDKTQTYEILNFVTFLARNGISSWDTAAQEELERDIEWLFSDQDEERTHPWWSLSAWTGKEFSSVPAVFQSNETVQIIQCENWLSKKWNKTKKFVKKHKKPIIIATAVIVVATVVIVATGGAGASPLAGAAAAAGAAGSNSPNNEDHPHINKPGDVRVQDDAPPQEIHQKDPPLATHPMSSPNTNQSLPAYPQVEAVENQDAGALSETIQYHSEMIKETLSEELPGEAFNVPSVDEPTFWENAANKTKEVTSWLAHDALKDTAECIGVPNEAAHEYHEKIDEIFGTDHASQYTPEALEKEPKIVKGVLPPPGGSLTTTAKRVATITGSTGVATATATVGSALTKGISSPPPTSLNCN